MLTPQIRQILLESLADCPDAYRVIFPPGDCECGHPIDEHRLLDPGRDDPDCVLCNCPAYSSSESTV